MSETQPTKASRRRFVVGAATAGAAATAVIALHNAGEVAPAADVKAAPPERGGGYQLSEHVKKYYGTTRT